jgi:hypothetical protein
MTLNASLSTSPYFGSSISTRTVLLKDSEKVASEKSRT